VHLYNGLTANGTGLHFHGIRQNFTNQMDGVPSITQCPTAPGEVGNPNHDTRIQLTKSSLSPTLGKQLNMDTPGTILISLFKRGTAFLVAL
jgi:FtsP/CotA-like multicopper oxidase with cupredoxin domain